MRFAVSRMIRLSEEILLDKCIGNPRPREEGDGLRSMGGIGINGFNPRPREEGDTQGGG